MRAGIPNSPRRRPQPDGGVPSGFPANAAQESAARGYVNRRLIEIAHVLLLLNRLLVGSTVRLVPLAHGVLELRKTLPGGLRRIDAGARRIDRRLDELHLGYVARTVWIDRARLDPHNQLGADGASDQRIVA